MKEWMNMKKTYTINVAGLTRDLPLCAVNDSLDIAAFVMFSDVELTVACAKALLEIVPEFDVILTAATKGIPIGYEMSRQSGKQYVVAKKSLKVYMTDPVSVDVKSITTAGMQKLYLSAEDIAWIKDRKVLIVDDVISTGASLAALQELARAAGGIISGSAAVLAEGEAADRDDIVFLEKLPVFPK